MGWVCDKAGGSEWGRLVLVHQRQNCKGNALITRGSKPSVCILMPAWGKDGPAWEQGKRGKGPRWGQPREHEHDKSLSETKKEPKEKGTQKSQSTHSGILLY